MEKEQKIIGIMIHYLRNGITEEYCNQVKEKIKNFTHIYFSSSIKEGVEIIYFYE